MQKYLPRAGQTEDDTNDNDGDDDDGRECASQFNYSALHFLSASRGTAYTYSTLLYQCTRSRLTCDVSPHTVCGTRRPELRCQPSQTSLVRAHSFNFHFHLINACSRNTRKRRRHDALTRQPQRDAGRETPLRGCRCAPLCRMLEVGGRGCGDGARVDRDLSM